MVRRISAQEARDNFSALIGSVRFSQEPVIVERRGRPYAVLISPEQFDRIEGERKERLNTAWQAIDRIRERNADKTEEEIEKLVDELVEQVRQERRGKERHTASRGS